MRPQARSGLPSVVSVSRTADPKKGQARHACIHLHPVHWGRGSHTAMALERCYDPTGHGPPTLDKSPPPGTSSLHARAPPPTSSYPLTSRGSARPVHSSRRCNQRPAGSHHAVVGARTRPMHAGRLVSPYVPHPRNATATVCSLLHPDFLRPALKPWLGQALKGPLVCLSVWGLSEHSTAEKGGLSTWHADTSTV
jgi:hypothetical protein